MRSKYVAVLHLAAVTKEIIPRGDRFPAVATVKALSSEGRSGRGGGGGIFPP